MKQHRFLVAGDIWLDREDDRLWQSGKALKIGSKPMGLLRALMQRPRTLVTKDQLFEQVWPEVTVSESVLTTAVKELRQALGDDARSPEIIQTVYGRGYRFLRDVEEREAASAEAHGVGVRALRQAVPRLVPRAALRAVLAMIVIALVAGAYLLLPAMDSKSAAESAAHPKSIAVLPFDDLSESGDQDWFAAGLTEEILNSLARTPDLHVAARTSTALLRTSDVREIGSRLNVAHVLEGSMRRDGDRVRVTAQLIRTSDGFHLWSQNYDRAAADVVSIQEDIAVAIAHALKTVMTPESLQAMVRLGTRSVEAYEEYLKALAYDRRSLETGNNDYARLSSEAYEKARTIDPGFAAAQWDAAQSWFGNSTRVGSIASEKRGSEKERLKEYLERVDDAILASRGRPEQFKYRSARALMDLRFREALQLMQRYLKERPRDVRSWEDVVDLAGYADDRALMAKAAERIHTLSIESGVPLSRAITASVLSTDFDNAVRRSREQLALRPGEAFIQYQAHRAFLWGGRVDEARAVLRSLRSSALPPDAILGAELRQACAEGGRGTTALIARIDALPERPLVMEWQVAMLLGDQRRAVELLKPLDAPDRLTTLMQYLAYPEFDSRLFPVLQQRLRANGISRARPVPIPFACRRPGLGRSV